MTGVFQDLRYATRGLAKNPGFTSVAVLTLALGIGANATIFSFADALLLRSLPVPDADRIVHVYQRRPSSSDPFPMSYADYLDYRAQTRSFEALAAHYDTSPMHLVVDGDPQAINGAVVTATYFDLLKLQPALDRFFRPEEDRVRDRDAVAVISYGLHLRLGGTANAIGQTIRINDHPHEIVGIVKDAQYYAAGQLPHAVVYRSYWQPNPDGGFNRDSRTIVRVTGDAAAMMPTIRRAVATVDLWH